MHYAACCLFIMFHVACFLLRMLSVARRLFIMLHDACCLFIMLHVAATFALTSVCGSALQPLAAVRLDGAQSTLRVLRCLPRSAKSPTELPGFPGGTAEQCDRLGASTTLSACNGTTVRSGTTDC